MPSYFAESIFLRLKLFYVRVRPDWMKIVYVNKRRVYEDIPQIAVDANHKIVGLGRDAECALREAGVSATMLNGFDHPRMVIADFLAAQATLMMFMRKIQSSFERVLPPVPTMVIHPLVRFDDGLTEVEKRALTDLGKAAGARRVYLCQEPNELTEEQLRLMTSHVFFEDHCEG